VGNSFSKMDKKGKQKNYYYVYVIDAIDRARFPQGHAGHLKPGFPSCRYCPGRSVSVVFHSKEHKAQDTGGDVRRRALIGVP
jgi:hypothetical protein